MTTSLPPVEMIRHLSKVKKRRVVIRILNEAATLEEPEQHLAMGVVKLAVQDIGNRQKRGINDSTKDFMAGSMNIWFEILGINREYVKRVFKHFNMLPIPGRL